MIWPQLQYTVAMFSSMSVFTAVDTRPTFLYFSSLYYNSFHVSLLHMFSFTYYTKWPKKAGNVCANCGRPCQGVLHEYKQRCTVLAHPSSMTLRNWSAGVRGEGGCGGRVHPLQNASVYLTHAWLYTENLSTNKMLHMGVTYNNRGPALYLSQTQWRQTNC